jgi:DnaJ-class molecular chaperone
MSAFVDEFFEGFVPGFYRQDARSRTVSKDLYLEVILTPEEARRGGIFPVTVPVMLPCPDCGQSGWWEEFYCPSCLGYGAVKSAREFKLTIPPDARDGIVVEVPMDEIGLPGVILHIDVRVEQYPYG